MRGSWRETKDLRQERAVVLRLRSEGESCRSIRDQAGISVSTIQRTLKDVVTA